MLKKAKCKSCGNSFLVNEMYRVDSPSKNYFYDGSIKNIAKYKDMEIVITGDENEPTEAERFNYMMLGRLQQDCKYYLGNGNRHKKHLWANDEVEQIKEMKKLYNSFTDDKKPEWLTMDQILEYENQMLQG